MKQRAGLLGDRSVRKAYASKGDDCTLSRWVKIPPGEQIVKGPAKRQQRFPGFERAGSVYEKGRSVFYRKGVKPVRLLKNLLVSGHSNVKIGRDVRKGRLFRGYWIYTLTLEERATCPRTCKHWLTCYGNHMPFAKRIEHGPEMIEPLRKEIRKLLCIGKRAGLLIRLHALGDFYSAEYVRFWEEQLERHPRLACFGYTARRPEDEIGAEVARVKQRFGRRFAIRWSDGGQPTDCTVSVKIASRAPANSFVCPEQTGATAACATCGLCWNTDRNVAFVEH